MTSGVPWNMRGLRPELLDSAREAARRSGMSVDEWLDTVIAESARHAAIKPAVRQLSDFDPRGRYREAPDTHGWRRDERGESSFSDLSARLDDLARQVDHLSSAGTARTPARHAAPGSDDPGAIADMLARLDRTIDRLSAISGATTRNDAPPTAPSLDPSAALEGSVDQALAEIEARQRMLDAGGAAGAPIPQPRAPSQRLGELERQLREVNARIQGMRPCGIDTAIETLRDDLAEIGVMLKEAMPRQAIEALETEIRSLASRIDNGRHAGADGATMAGVERGLAEVRDALRALTPAENLVGIDQTLQSLSQKIDRVAGAGQDPEALKQLEGAIVALRGVVSHVASNDALAQLSDEVRALTARVSHVTPSDAFSLMEQRIAEIADALGQPRGAGDTTGLETAMRGLADKVDQLQASNYDPTAVTHLQDRMVRLVEKLDASDARFDNLGAIERGLADLLMQMEGQRMASPPAAGESAESDALKRDVQRTQDSLETVHGTLGHVVDRLATIEAGIVRDHPAPPAVEPADRRVNAPSPAEPTLPGLLQTPPVAPTQTAMFREAPAADAPSAPRINPSPAVERRPIDPDLPPDHPLEPGAGRGRGASPADRIAASEAALENMRAPVIPDPAGKSNFIAAARRAAQAAIVDAPPAKEKRAAETAARGEAGKSLAGRIGGSIRKLMVGVFALAIVLGAAYLATKRFWPDAVQFVASRLWPGATPTAEHPFTTYAARDGTISEAEPPRVLTPAPAPQVSTVLPSGISISPNPFGAGVPPVTPAGVTAGADSTGSIQPPRAQPATIAPPAILPATAPARAPTPADGLPGAIAGGLRAAAAKGDAAAEFEIASRFADGRGVPQNLPEAATWFERAANQGLTPAQFRLGGLYEKGIGVQKNLDTARRLYLAAAEAGHGKAMHNLAVLYAEGIEGKPNYATAAHWFRKAADHGVVDSQYNLAILYARGIGVESNLAESFKWFALASRDGDRDAAKKRDEIASRLDKQTLAAAMAAAQAWQAQPQPEAAIQVRVPPGGWDAAPTPAGPKRAAVPKAEKQSKRPAQ